MPFGAPPPPYTVGQGFPTENPRWVWDGAKWISVAGQLVNQALPLPMVNTDQLLVLRNVSGVQTAFTVAASDLADYAGGAPAASAPAAFTVLQWGLASIAGGLRFTITALPADGGSAITELQYRLNGGAWTAFSAATTGAYDITGLPATLHTAEVRAVNAVGAGATSDTKSETPAATGGGGGALTIVQAPTAVEQPYGTTAQQTLSPVGTGNSLVVAVHVPSSAAVPAISDSAGNTWPAPMRSYPDGAGVTTYYWKLDNITNAPTWVRATLTGAEGFHIAAVEVSGAGAGLVEDDFDSGLQTSTDTWNMGFTSTAANALLVGMLKVDNSNTFTPVAPLSASSATGGYQIFVQGIFPTAGANTATVGLSSGISGSRSWLVLKGS